ncbi:hypothetical protein SMICM17S_03662 [Streptomyces microflavus]
MFDPFIAPSGTLLGLLQRGRGDGTLHALAAPRPEALAALNHCVVSDPRHDWQVENRSLYYARLHHGHQRAAGASKRRAREAAGDRADDRDLPDDPLPGALTDVLAALEPAEIIDFAVTAYEVTASAYRWPLWNAAYLIEGGCGDDGFMDFRDGLVLLGRRPSPGQWPVPTRWPGCPWWSG